MKTYTFLRTMKYTETVEILADSQDEAYEIASETDGYHNNDDTVHDMEFIKVED